MARNKIFFSTSFKFIIVISLVIILTSIVLSLFFINTKSTVMRGIIENEAEILARTLASSSEYPVLSQSGREILSYLTKNTIKHHEDLLYSVIYDKTGDVLSEAEIQNQKVINFVQSTPIKSVVITDLEKNRYHKDLLSISGVGDILEVIVPIISREYFASPDKAPNFQENLIGIVRVGFSLKKINYQIKKMISIILIITLIVIFVVITISPFLVKIFIRTNKNIQE